MKATPTKPACNVTLDPLIRGLVHDSFPRSSMAPGPETVSTSLLWEPLGKLVSPAAGTQVSCLWTYSRILPHRTAKFLTESQMSFLKLYVSKIR